MFRHETILGLLDLSQLRGVKPARSKHGSLVTEVIALPRVSASVSASCDGICGLKHFSSSESLYFCKSQTGKLETVRLRRIQPVINALMRELTHMVFSLQCGFECPIAEHRMKTLIKVYMTFPCP